MTKINRDLREDIKSIENYITTILRNQPLEDEACQVYLYKALTEIRKKARKAFEDYVFNFNEQLKLNCRKENEKTKHNGNL